MDEMNVNEQILQAFQIVAQGEIKKIHFDQTIKATIIGDEAADEGRYWCSNGFSEFWAYSTEVRYRNNDKVLVTIPEGDYSNTTKVIISKQADENNSPLILASPLAMMVDLTNNLITGEIEEATWANYGRVNSDNLSDCGYSWDKDTKDFINSTAFQHGKPFYDSGINKIYETNITRLGFSAQFSTWLTEYATISGNYGIAIELTFKDNDREGVVENYTLLKSEPITSEIYCKKDGQNFIPLDDDERAALFDIFTTDAKKLAGIQFYESGENKGKITGTYVLNGHNVQVFKYAPSNEFLKYTTFDSEEFFGDIYGYDTYYTNEVVFDLSEFSKYAIIRIRAWLYQRDNFRTMSSDYVEAPKLSWDFSNINPNIFMKDPYLCLGVEASEFTSDRAELITSCSSTFYKTLKSPNPEISDDTSEKRRLRENLKKIHLRWTHKDENTGIIRLVESDEYPEDYEIRWYRWALGKPSCDEFSGAHWERFYGCKDTPNSNGDYAITEAEMISLSNWSRDPTNTLDATLFPNINHSQEKLKAIILKVENPTLTTYIKDSATNKITTTTVPGDVVYRFAAETKEITFFNDDEVRNEQTYIDVNALSIKFDDGSNGHYFLYNRAGNVSKDSDLEIRTLTLVFDENETDVYKKPNAPSNVPITWHFPESMTMITPATSAGLDGKPTNVYTFTDTISVGYFIKKSLSRQDNNNTVTAEATIDGVTYSAMVQMAFGTAGTSGSDYTLDIVWNNNALDVTNPKESLLIGQVGLYDSAGNQILGDNETITDLTSDYELKYEWEVAELIDADEIYDYNYEEHGVLYPTFKEKSSATFDQEGSTTGESDEDTYGGYYYFVDNKDALRNKFNTMCGYNIITSSYKVDTTILETNKTDIFNKLKTSNETLAFFDMNQEKFVYLKDFFQDLDTLTAETIETILFTEQLYRKRAVDNLRVVKTIRNEKFYRDLIDVFIQDNNNIYTNLLMKKSNEEDNDYITRLENMVEKYNLRLKAFNEIGASNFTNLYHHTTETVEEIAEVIEKEDAENEQVKLEKIKAIDEPYSQYLQKLFKDLTNENDFYSIILSIEKPLLKVNDAYINIDNLTVDINYNKEQYYEELFNALFETNNFYYNYLKININDLNCVKPTNLQVNEKDVYFYAQKIGSKLKYIFQYIAAAENEQKIKDRLYSENILGTPGDELYLCSQIAKVNNLINESLIAVNNTSDYEFSYEWPKPKIDYKAIQAIEGREESQDDDEFNPKVFTSSESNQVWKTQGKFQDKGDINAKLAKAFFPSLDINTSTALKTKIENLSKYTQDIKTSDSSGGTDVGLTYKIKNSSDTPLSLVTYLRPDTEINTRESVLEKLKNLKSSGGVNWITDNYEWKYNNASVSDINLYTYFWKALLTSDPSASLNDAVIAGINSSSYKNPKINDSFDKNNSELTKYFKESINNDVSKLESIYHYLITGINSKNRQQELYEYIRDNLNNLKKYIQQNLSDVSFIDSGNITQNFYRTLAKYCGIYDKIYEDNTESVFAEDKLTFYSAFNFSVPVGSNSKEEQLQYISNIFIKDNNNYYYRLADYLNLSGITLNNVLGLYNNLTTQGLVQQSSFDLDLDQELKNFLEAYFGKNKISLTTDEKNHMLETIFSATTSSAINNYVSTSVINIKNDVNTNITNNNLIESNNNFIYSVKNLQLNNFAGTIEAKEAYEDILSVINSVTNESYLNYFSAINRAYRQGYNSTDLYRMNKIANSEKWRLLYLLLCNISDFPTTELEGYIYAACGNLSPSSHNDELFKYSVSGETKDLYFLAGQTDTDVTRTGNNKLVGHDMDLNNSTYSNMYSRLIDQLDNLNGDIYYYDGSTSETTDSETVITHYFKKVITRTNYIKFLKINAFRQKTDDSIISVNSFDISSNYNLNASKIENLCKYALDTSTLYQTKLKTNKDKIGVLPASASGFKLSNYNSSSTPFIKYSNNKYDNISDYLIQSIVTSGTNFSISFALITELCTLITGNSVILALKENNKDNYVSSCFNLLINDLQESNDETLLSESLVSLETFTEAFLSNWTISTATNDLTQGNTIVRAPGTVNTYQGSGFQLFNESTQAYRDIFKTLKISLDNNTPNPTTYADSSVAAKGWRERMYDTVRNFYNNFSYNGVIQLKTINSADISSLNFYEQLYSTVFGVSDAAASSDQIYSFNSNLYNYIGSTGEYGPIINYRLLLTKYVTNTEDSNNLLSIITKQSNPSFTQDVFIVENNKPLQLNTLLKSSGSPKKVTDTSLRTVYLYLENASTYYSAYTDNSKNTVISQREAYKRIFESTLTYDIDSITTNYNNIWNYLLQLYNINSSVLEDLSTQIKHTSATNNLFQNYYYGLELNIDSAENFLYNLNAELNKCFNDLGVFNTTIGKNKFFDILATLENDNIYIYSKNTEENLGLSILINDCQNLWSLPAVSNDNYITTCKDRINNTIEAYNGFTSTYQTNIQANSELSKYSVRSPSGTVKLWEFFDGNTIEEMITQYQELQKSSYSILISNSEQEHVGGISVFNYQNSKNLKPFIKINDNYIVDPYYKSNTSGNDTAYKGYRIDETYYYPEQRPKEKGKTVPLVYSPKGDTGRTVWIYPNPSLIDESDSVKKLMSSLSVLKVTLSNFGDYDLVAYFPLAVKQGTKREEDLTIKFTPSHLQGATYVRYTSFGETDFEKTPYRLFSKELNNDRTDISYEDLRLKFIPTGVTSLFGWKMIYPQPEGIDNSNFIPELKESQGIEVAEDTNYFKLPLLYPVKVYIPEAVPYGISCYYQYGDLYGSSDIPVWTQTVYCYEDNYPSTTINQWDGKTILTDDETGIIVSSAIAAGKKESDNTFTGVMMGDWSRSDTDPAIAAHTGLFGFNHGSMSYAFKDDGTGFIGKDGRGRIVFDGNKSQIYSNNWKGREQRGMFLDIDDGIIKLQSETKVNDEFYEIKDLESLSDGDHNVEPKEIPANEGQRYITLSSKESTYPLAIGLDSSLSQRKFKVKWNGSAYMENAYLKDAYLDNVYAKGYINATGGRFTKEIDCSHGKILGAYITCQYLEANIRGDIAGWTIAANGLINKDHSTMLLTNTEDIELKDADGEVIQKINNPFQASIVTNRIAVQAKGLSGTGQFMELGYLTGTADGISQTEGMGIKGPSRIILESSSPGDDIAHIAIALKATAGVVGLYGKSVQMSLGGTVENAAEGVYIQAQGLQVNVPADAQTGIYARFA